MIDRNAYTPVDIITALMLHDRRQARDILRHSPDDQLSSECIITIDRINFELERIAERNAENLTPRFLKEDYAAEGLVKARNNFNIALIRHKFIDNNGINFLVTHEINKSETRKIRTTTPYTVCQQLKKAVAAPSITHVIVTLFEQRPERVTAEDIFRFGTAEVLLANMLADAPERYLDIALATANIEMIIKAVRAIADDQIANRFKVLDALYNPAAYAEKGGLSA